MKLVTLSMERHLPGLHGHQESHTISPRDPVDIWAEKAADFLITGHKPKEGKVSPDRWTRGVLALTAPPKPEEDV